MVGGNAEKETEIIDELKVQVRVMCTTQRNLTTLADDGQIRTDLLYRLNVLQLSLPPLQEREADIEPLIHQFSQQIALVTSIFWKGGAGKGRARFARASSAFNFLES